MATPEHIYLYTVWIKPLKTFYRFKTFEPVKSCKPLSDRGKKISMVQGELFLGPDDWDSLYAPH